jgi:hypothetical protein
MVQGYGILPKSTGCIAYELLTGHGPLSVVFQHMHENSRTPMKLNPPLPIHSEQGIHKEMEKAPNDRHTDVAAFIAALGVSTISQVPTPPVSCSPVASHAQKL